IPKSQRFTFGQRIDGRTLDVLELIVQCIYRTDRTTGLHRINLELEVLRVLWRVVQKRGWLSLNQLDYAQARIDEAGRMVGGWLKQQRE
ncbi:MAG: diversity-generating retroelement protein Avd, partial [Lentisphaerae bacterium]|nr:diversity-generating retroelement protein Avd [Lentisphaerota bacterium]